MSNQLILRSHEQTVYMTQCIGYVVNDKIGQALDPEHILGDESHAVTKASRLNGVVEKVPLLVGILGAQLGVAKLHRKAYDQVYLLAKHQHVSDFFADNGGCQLSLSEPTGTNWQTSERPDAETSMRLTLIFKAFMEGLLNFADKRWNVN